MELIRIYREFDWRQVSKIYDLSKPDEMEGLVTSDFIIPLEKMIYDILVRPGRRKASSRKDKTRSQISSKAFEKGFFCRLVT